METSPKKNSASALTSSYAEIEQIRSEMDFYSDEIRFFRILIDKYLFPLIDKESISKIQEISRQLSAFEKEKDAFSKDLAVLTRRYAETNQGLGSDSEGDNNILYFDLLNKTRLLKSSFKGLKKAFFTIMEHLLRTEKMQKLLEIS